MAVTDLASWRRVPPVAILHFASKGVTDIVRHGWQVLAAGGIGIGVTGGAMQTILIWIAIGLFAALIMVIGFLRYWHFRFRAGEERFEAQQGVFHRQSLSLHYARVQSVAIVQPVYYRPFGRVVLKLESAGSSAQELAIAGISKTFAEQVRDHVLRCRAVAQPAPDDHIDGVSAPASAETDERLVLHRPLGEIARHGLCSNNVWIFAAFLGSLWGSVETRFALQAAGWVEAHFDRLTEAETVAMILAVLTVAVVAIVVVATLSVITSIVLHYDFRLYRGGTGLRRRSGLLETREASLNESKAQCLVREQTPIGLLLNRCEGRVVQAGSQPTGNAQQSSTPSFMVPAITPAEFEDLAELLYSDYARQATPLRSIDRAYVRKTLQYRWLSPALAVAVVGWAAMGAWAALALVAPLIGLPLTALAHRRYGYAMDAEFGWVSSGLVGRSLTIFPLFKVQSVTLHQSPFQRQRELADLRIDLAGRRLRVPFMPLQDARTWRDRLLHAAGTDHRAWI